MNPPSLSKIAATFAGAVALIALLPAAAHAQAWIHDPGHGYAEVSYRTMTGDAFFDADGEITDLRSAYTQTTLQAYGEVGVVPRWLQVVVDGEVFRYNRLADQGATSGLGDTGVGLWTGILQDEFKVSAGVRAGLPTGDPEPEAPGDNPQTDIIAASLPTGDGVFDFTPTLAFGYGHAGESGFQSYVTATGGYQLRLEEQMNAVQWRLEGGIRLPGAVIERFWFALRVRGLHPLGDPSRSSFSGLGSGAAYVSPGLSISAEIYRGFGVRAGAEGAVYARNIVAALPIQAGLFYDF